MQADHEAVDTTWLPGEGLPPWLWNISAVAIALSGPLVCLLLMLGAPVWGAIALHLLAAPAAYLMWRRPGPRGQMLGLQAFTLLLCFPIVGSPAAWLIYGRESERNEGLLSDYRRYISYDHGEPRYLKPVRDAKAALRRELAVQPFGDQLNDADLVGKQNAAAALERLDGDTGVRVLKRALTHPADDTRLLASLSLLRKEEHLVRKLKAARTSATEFPQDPQATLLVADAARRYAESGLPAGKVAENFWTECLKAAEQTLALEPRPTVALTAHLHRAAAAAALGDHLIAIEAAEAALALDAACAEAGLRRMEALFMLGRLDALSGATDALESAEPGSEGYEVSRYWRRPNAG
jgi:hypothetical protein